MGLTAVANGENQIDLTWDTNPESDIDYYQIYRDGSPYATSVSTIYSDTGLSPG
ncbi:MAG: hypothetical protein BAJALOKI3v1_180001 [Promethearchaeota archaeon]|nr:MAG: hypothetical protein BAJALOKI3v1_180001 [Candidatus Lokiarchaeota archaeon]